MSFVIEPSHDLAPEPSRFAILRRILLGQRSTILASIIIAIFVAIAVLAPMIAPYDPLAQSYLRINAYPSGELAWNGSFGRDVLSRLIYGSRNSLIFGLISPTLAAIFGTALGVAAGYFGGIVDRLVSGSSTCCSLSRNCCWPS